LILVRELDERLGLSELIGEHLTDYRGPISRLPLADLFRQLVYSRMARHARYFWFLSAESNLTRRLFGSMSRRIEALPLPAG